MGEIRNTGAEKRMRAGILLFAAALLMSVLVGCFSLIAHAQSTAKVTTRSAKIRKEANASSDVLASVVENDSLTVTGQVTGADGNIWYQVFVDANTKGYIRSDLASITDGSTPPTISADAAESGTDTPAADTAADDGAGASTPVTEEGVTAMNPISGTTSAGSVRVRSNPSTAGQIVATTENGTAVTVTGTANGADGRIWYYVNFNSNGTEIVGYIRSDFVTLSGELTPVEPVEPSIPEETDADDGGVPLSGDRDWDTQYEGDVWYLVDVQAHERYNIQQFFELEDNAEKIQQMYDAEHKQNRVQRAVVIILVVILIVMAGAIAMMLFKVKDLQDELDFAEAEKQNNARRAADRPRGTLPGSGKGKPVSRPQNGERRIGESTARPAGGKTAQKPSGAPRMAGQAQNGGQRAQTESSRQPAQKPHTEAPRQTAQKPQAEISKQSGQRPQEAKKPSTNSNAAAQAQGNTQPQRAKANRALTEDDEFEFEFLNWDGDEDF